ncbi:SPFH domain-containing protein [Microtetraspora fusca]|uniref:SPFH domain-containing protein n=1 Tax=Microtetraspora fusca TaxID=1997 RepID=A0ABW6VEP4_MICFU
MTTTTAGRLALALAAAALLAAACAQTDANEIALNYSGGPIEGVSFLRCIPPNKVQPLGWDDSAYVYRRGQLAYRFDSEDGAQAGPIEIVSRDNVKMTVPGAANFALNTACDKLRAFHERIAKGYGVDFADDNNPHGWDKLVNTYLGQPLARAMKEAASGYNMRALYNDARTYTAWSTKVGQLASKYTRELAGDDYFCAPTFQGTGDCGSPTLVLQKPSPPQEMEEALAAEQVAKVQKAVQEQVNARTNTEMKSLRQLEGVLGAQWAVLYKIYQSSDHPPFVPLPSGGSIQMTSPTK